MNKSKLVENGICEEPKEHFEYFETKVYIYRIRDKRYPDSFHTYAQIRIPIPILNHLTLKNKDKISVAIKKTEFCEKGDEK